jgi:hypothetical protein
MQEQDEDNEIAMISPGSPPPPERWLAAVSANRGTILERRSHAPGKENLPPSSTINAAVATAVDEEFGMEVEVEVQEADDGIFVFEDVPRYEPIVLTWPEEQNETEE